MKEIISEKSGFIKDIPADEVAKYVCGLGAGRIRKEDKIDMAVGVVLHKKAGDRMEKGEVIATIYSNKPIEIF